MASAGSTESTAWFSYPKTRLRRQLKLTDATPKNLKRALKLPGYPFDLLDIEQDLSIFFNGDGSDSPFSDLVPNKEYEVQLEDVDTNDGQSKKQEMPPRLSEKVSIDDIQRAMMCCQAIYQDGPEKVVQFLNKPENLCLHNFGKVCVSRYGRLTYMLAETDDKDELFIAFRGTQSYEDILSDLSIWQGSGGTRGESAMGGKCHAGFLELASCFPVDPILRKYVYSRRDDSVRIVVCGHSMGGAVAHIVTLNMLAALQSDKKKVVSIAIGAPFFGDSEMRDYAEKHELSDNLLTIVNQNDPVPRLLQLAEAFQCATEAGAEKVKGVVEKTLPFLKMSLQALSYTGIGGQAINTAAAAIAMVDQLPAHLEHIRKSLGTYVQEMEDVLKYTPLGWYMLITHYRPPGSGQKTQWHASYMETAAEVVQAMRVVGEKQWSVDRRNEHKITEYATVYPNTTVLGQPRKFNTVVHRKSPETSKDSQDKIKKPREVVPYNPFKLTIGYEDISLARIDPVGPKEQTKLRISVKGQHLEFFILPEKPFTGIPADMEKGIQTNVNIGEVTLECELEENKPMGPVPTVHLKTHFEEKKILITPKQVKKVKGLTPSESAVNELSPAVLLKAIQRSLSNILLAQNRTEARETDAILKLLSRLDGERKSVKAGKDEVKLKKMIDDAKTLDDLMKNKDLFRVVGEILAEFGQYLKVTYTKPRERMLMATLMNLVSLAFVGLAASGLPEREPGGILETFFGVIFLGSGAGVGIGAGYFAVNFVRAGLKFLYLSLFRTYEQNYKEILRMLIKELPDEPSGTQDGGTNADDGTVYSLERALHTKCKGLGFLTKPDDEVINLGPFKVDSKLNEATPDSKKEVIRRCKMACDLFAIRQLIQKSCFVGLFGPQNAGKTTLIEKTWGVTVKERGFKSHTVSPDLYKAKGTDRMVIIDFPGTSTIDDLVANLATNCGGLSSILILVMPFQEDTSTDHITQMAKANKLAEDFNCSILLCISNCIRYKDILKDQATVDSYREDYASQLEIDRANILFTELVETGVMESRGVVGPEGVRNWVKNWLLEFDVFSENDPELYAAVNMTME